MRNILITFGILAGLTLACSTVGSGDSLFSYEVDEGNNNVILTYNYSESEKPVVGPNGIGKKARSLCQEELGLPNASFLELEETCFENTALGCLEGRVSFTYQCLD